MKRMYIVDAKCGGDIKEIFEGVSKKEVEVTQGACYERLPTGYDVYLLHLSNVEEKDIIELRKNSPTAIILTTSRNGVGHIPDALNGVIEKQYSVILERDVDEIFEFIGVEGEHFLSE